MKKQRKIIIKIGLIMILLLNLLIIKSFALVEPTREFYVNDSANLIDKEVENYIIETNKKLNSNTGAQIVVVTVNNLEGQSLEEYSNALFRKYGIGDSKKNNGVLLLLALEERQFRIEVGYGLEGILNDAKTGRIQDSYIIPYLKNNNWNEGIRNGYSKILEEVSIEYGVDVGEINCVEVNKVNESKGSGIITFVILVICPLIFSLSKKVVRIILISDSAIAIVTILIGIIFPDSFINFILRELIIFEGLTFIICIFALLMNISKIGPFFGGGFYTGGSSGMGRRLFRRWRLFRRRRFFRRRRLFKKFLKM